MDDSLFDDDAGDHRGSTTHAAERRLRRAGPGTILLVVLALAYFVTVVTWAVRQRGESYDDLPPFTMLTKEEFGAFSDPDLDVVTQLIIAPKGFDRAAERLTVEVAVRPAGWNGDIQGEAWFYRGSDGRLRFPGARLATAPERSELLFEGDPASLTLRRHEQFQDPGASSPAVRAWSSGVQREQSGVVESTELSAPFDVVLDVETYGRSFDFRDDVFWYPFDSYGFQLNVTSLVRPWFQLDPPGFRDAPGPWFPAPISLTPDRGNEFGGRYWTTMVGDWAVSMRPTGWLSTDHLDTPARVQDLNLFGLGGMAFVAERPVSVRLLAVLFALVYAASIASLLIVLRVIGRGGRPPTGNMLVWAAALVFASVSLRDGLPGDVPYGVLFDWLVFFPTLIVSILSTLYLAIVWVRRADFTP